MGRPATAPAWGHTSIVRPARRSERAGDGTDECRFGTRASEVLQDGRERGSPEKQGRWGGCLLPPPERRRSLVRGPPRELEAARSGPQHLRQGPGPAIVIRATDRRDGLSE